MSCENNVNAQLVIIEIKIASVKRPVGKKIGKTLRILNLENPFKFGIWDKIASFSKACSKLFVHRAGDRSFG